MSMPSLLNRLNLNQIKMAELITTKDVHRMTVDEMCDEVGISKKTYYRWKQDKYFNQYLEEVQEEIMKNFLSETYDRLRSIVSNGSDRDALKGIEVVLKSLGKLKNDTPQVMIQNNMQTHQDLEQEILEMEQELLEISE